ncbi:MAG: tripartite tricarboxylate transporter substrate-binding protein [Hydrogenophaga sp.]|uniref:tripartite tricarboxylate transporter substrate-binding protein n=1 Tax=Hydrogenophaga sp. TaxID=1904254 RepID=UPI003D09A403
MTRPQHHLLARRRMLSAVAVTWALCGTGTAFAQETAFPNEPVRLMPMVQNMLLRPNPGYKMEAVTPVPLVATISIAFGVNSSLGNQTVADLVKYAKGQPEVITYGTSGAGSGSHLVGAALASSAGFKATHIPYVEEVGFVPVGNSSEEFARYITTEMDTWSKVIKQNDIKVD